LIVAVGVVLCYTAVLKLFTFSDLALAFQRFAVSMLADVRTDDG